MNPELRNLTTRVLIGALEQDGFFWVRSKGSHRLYRHKDGRRVIVSFHRPSSTFPPKTLARMLHSTKWGREDMKRLGLIS